MRKVKSKVWFIRRPGLKWSALRLLLNSPWEDVVIELSNSVYGVDRNDGVVRYDPDAFDIKYPTKTWATVTIPNSVQAKRYLDSQLGKPMDIGALFPCSPLRQWTYPARWYSCELVAKALMIGSTFPYPEVGRVTPRKLWSLLPTVVVTG